MKLDEFVAVSGTSEIFRLVTAKQNGILVKNLDTGKNKFFSSRNHQFNPLGTISIYTLEDTVDLSVVFTKMLTQKATLPVPSHKEDKLVLFEYFEKIVPDFDEDRVYHSDIKKVIKWFTYLDERDVLTVGGDEEE